MIAVRFFAAAREAVGVDLVNIPFTGSVAELRIDLMKRWSAMSSLLPRCAIAVNRTYAEDDALIVDDDEVAVLPPVSGG